MGSTNRSERGAGSVFYDKSSKRWVVMVSLPKAGDGKRRRSRRTFRTKAEAMGFLTGGDAPQPVPVDAVTGMGELLEELLQQVVGNLSQG